MACCPRSDSREKGFCTWPIAIAFLLSLAVTIILILTLGPIEKGVSQALPDFEPIELDDDLLVRTASPTPSPGSGADSPTYDFLQCPEDGGECCNGLESNCNLRLNEVMFAVAHNAMSTRESGYSVGYNHLTNLDGALQAGFRGLNLDVCKCDGKISLCHTFCGYGDRDPAQVFLEIMNFLTNHPTELVVLVFQFSTGDPSVAELYEVMESVHGFVDQMYKHDPNEPEWPLMKDLLINEEKRIVAFQHDAKDDCSVVGACPAELHGYFDYVADTAYKFESVAAVQNWEASCEVTRGGKGLQSFFNVNNFLTPANQGGSKTLNEKNFVVRRLDECSAAVGLVPNFVTVDFWSEGDLPEVVQTWNAAKAELQR